MRSDYLDEAHDAPPSGPKRFVRRVKCNESITVICYSKTWWGVWTHWNGRRSEPHFKKKALCNGCRHGMPKRWKGYLDVHNSESNAREVLEITPGMVEEIESQLPAGDTLRGCRFTAKRGKGEKARVHVHFHAHLSHIKPNAAIPNEEDPKPVLWAMWGLSTDENLGDDIDMSLPNQEAV